MEEIPVSKENAVVEEILEHLSQATPEFQKEILSVVTALKATSDPDDTASKERKEPRNEGT